MSSTDIQISINELIFFKEFYQQQPDAWLDTMSIAPNDWPPPEDWLKEPPHLNHKVKSKRGAVCLCVWDLFKEATNRSLIDYFKCIIPYVNLPIDVNEQNKIRDGRHRLIAYKELGISDIPVYINRKKVPYGYCWRHGVAYNDGTIDMTVKNNRGFYALR